ncbi:hypothetical protein [Staphylococcus cohnii]|uniref:hypothetical protein n=1 Tax=Staphylococcus cohnii TaxID=29382 RepID=UPI001484F687|nr:hypothetical protein [Staphylococcus cohnii]
MENNQQEIEKAVLQHRLFEEVQRSTKLQTELEMAYKELEAYKSQLEHDDE